MSRRFVILRHSGHGPLHYDWMLESGEALATWRTLESPENLAIGNTVEAGGLPDHRLAYLDYEGPVSGDRGSVERVAAGSYELIECTPVRWVVRLITETTPSVVMFAREDTSADCWRLERVE